MVDWVQVLKEIVDERWFSSSSPVLLSQVPRLLSSRGIDVRAVLRGRKLLETIEQDAMGQLKLVKDAQQPLIFFLLPHEVEASKKEFLPAERKSIPRFQRSFWVAFIKNIENGKYRYWDNFAKSFDDYDTPQLALSSAVEIERKYVLGSTPGVPPDSELVFKNIVEWCNAHSMSLDSFIASATSFPTRERKSLFDAMSDLPDSDLQRISVPLDIVRKLMRNREIG